MIQSAKHLPRPHADDGRGCPWHLMRRRALIAASTTLLVVSFIAPTKVRAQERWEVPDELLQRVMPEATRFTSREGEPPVFRGYHVDATTGVETLTGYAFLTSDIPPEELGYSGPIEVLVGLDLTGTLTGIYVTYYYESFRESRGDFLSRPGFQEQFTGKPITDPFRSKRDIAVVSRATITTAAMSRGIRNAARRVWEAYLAAPLSDASRGSLVTVEMEELEQLSWQAMVAGGLAHEILVLNGELLRIQLAFAYIRDAAVGRLLLGDGPYETALLEAGPRGEEDHLMLVGMDGALALLFRPQALFIVQGSDTLSFGSEDIILLGEPREGKVALQFRNMGILMVERALDVTQPFTILFDLRPGMGLYTTEYPAPATVVVAEAPATATAPDDLAVVDEPVAREVPADVTEAAAAEGPTSRDAEPEPSTETRNLAVDSVEVASTPTDEADLETAQVTGLPAGAPDALVFDLQEEETVLQRTLARTSWWDVGLLLALLGLATVAFFLKRPGLRWAALAATFLYLGAFNGGFLSVSHIAAAISVGPTVYLQDIPLLLIVSFTVLTTLLWGRVFCGFLCPFGALQDFLERIVPARFRRDLPGRVHDRALWIKYLFLAVVLTPALVGSQTSLFQYFEPFGTVFFLSSSALLWTIAGGVLIASAIVPRFYCRYACPLGAALAIGSLLSPFRIRRVEHCDHCKVCENSCPTGAIRGPAIDFKECVRCNICEVNLIEGAGVCGHGMEEVRPRLVQLRTAQGVGIADGS